MKGFLLPGIIAAAAMMMVGVAKFAPKCDTESLRGPTIAGSFLVAGCR